MGTRQKPGATVGQALITLFCMTFLMACLVEVEAPPERRHEGRHHAPRRTLDHETVAARVRLASILAVAVACLYSLLDLVRALI